MKPSVTSPVIQNFTHYIFSKLLVLCQYYTILQNLQAIFTGPVLRRRINIWTSVSLFLL